MSAKQYKARGTGDTREIWDGDVLIGRIHRQQTKTASISINFKRGTEYYRTRTVTVWFATWPSGAPAMRRDDGRCDYGREYYATIKAWKSPKAWAALKPPD